MKEKRFWSRVESVLCYVSEVILCARFPKILVSASDDENFGKASTYHTTLALLKRTDNNQNPTM